MTSPPPPKPVIPICLDDLVPRENVKGGGAVKVIFGAGTSAPSHKPKSQN